MFTAKELRGNNSMLGRVQRQQEYASKESLNTFNSVPNVIVEDDDDFGSLLKGKKLGKQIEKHTIKEPKKIITKFELGNKRRLLR